MNFGLTPEQEKLLKDIFEKHAVSGQVIVYGARAKGNFTDRSDIDLVVKSSNVNNGVMAEIKEEIEESDFPYLVDLQVYEEIENPALIEHIDRVGKVLYGEGGL